MVYFYFEIIKKTKKLFQELNKMKLRLNESNIIWPGRLTKKPEGFMIPTHLKVLTIEEKPFVYVRPLKKDDGNSCKTDEIMCPMYNTSKGKIFLP